MTIQALNNIVADCTVIQVIAGGQTTVTGVTCEVLLYGLNQYFSGAS